MLALILLGMGLIDVPQSERTTIENLSTEIEPLREARVGSLSAGIFCLPRGSLYREDFVGSVSDFRDVVESELANYRERASTDVEKSLGLERVALRSIDARLCAKKYGVWGTGEQSALSGRISIQFDVDRLVAGRAITSTRTIAFDIEGAKAMTARQIFAKAVSQLIAELSKSNEHPSN